MLLNRARKCAQLLPIVTSMVALMCLIVSGFKSAGFRSTGTAVRLVTKRNLNRVLCEQEEVQHSSTDDSILLTLKKDDFRANHINKILKLKVGDNIRGGVVNMGMTNCGTIEETGEIVRINLGKKSDLYLTPKPSVDLILAVPRPRRLELLLPIVSCLGIRKLILIEARKVDKDYFGSHLLRTPAAMRSLLVKGLSQAEVDCHLPEVHIKRNLRHFLSKEFDELCPPEDNYRLIAHPPLQAYNVSKIAPITPSTLHKLPPMETLHSEYVKSKDSIRFSEYMQHLHRQTGSEATAAYTHSRSSKSNSDQLTPQKPQNSKGMVIAVGPEGGWDNDEVEMFQQRGFQLVNLGPRILRTDIAVPLLLGLAHEHLSSLQK